MSAEAEALEVVENPSVPVFYADDVLAVHVFGHRARITYYEVREIGGRLVRWPVLEMIRPAETIASNRLLALLAAAMKRATGGLGSMLDLH